MNAIQLLSAQPWVERLGWTLLHFLWQGVLIAAVYAAIRKWIAHSAGPNSRYLLGCAVLAGMAAAPLVTWILLRQAAPVMAPVPAHFAATSSAASGIAGTTAGWLRTTGTTYGLTEPLLPWVVVLWLAGAMAFWFRLVGRWI
jgi:hypothetical protein